MNNTISNKIIILGSIIFSFFFMATNTFAYSCIGYSCESYNRGNYSQGWYSNDYTQQVVPVEYVPTNTNTKPTIINNYYYEKTATSDNTTTINREVNSNDSSNISDNNSTTNKGQEVEADYYRDNLGASAYNSYDQSKGNDITALSLRGSGSFMPSSIWQWIFVIILILIIIIVSRMFMHKPATVSEVHNIHAH